MKVCLCTIAYRDKLFDVALDAAVATGYRHVELWGREPHVNEVYDESRMRIINKMVQERNLCVPVFGSYLRFGKTSHTEDNVPLLDTLHTAHALKAGIVRVWASDVGSAQASEETWKKVVAEAQETADRGARMDLMFAIEMHDNSLADTGASARRLVEEIGRDNMRINFQIGTTTEDPPMERLEAVLPYVVHVHCQNYLELLTNNRQKLQRVPLSEGVVDYRPLIERLRESGYDGCLAVEFAHTEGEGRAAALAADRLFLESL